MKPVVFGGVMLLLCGCGGDGFQPSDELSTLKNVDYCIGGLEAVVARGETDRDRVAMALPWRIARVDNDAGANRLKCAVNADGVVAYVTVDILCDHETEARCVSLVAFEKTAARAP